MEEIIEETAVRLGPVSLLPIAVIFAVSIITKRSLLGLFSGVVTGTIIVAAHSGESFTGTLFSYIQGTFGNEDYQWITLVVLIFGVMIVLFEKSGAVTDFGRWMGRFVKTRRQALVGTFLFGVIVFLDDYLSNLTVGATMRRITDSHKIPRTQLVYVVLLMAGPVSMLIPVSSWTAAYVGIFESEGILYNGSAMAAFLRSIPFMYYAWVILIVCFLQITGLFPKLGVIKRDTAAAERTGELFPNGVSAEGGQTTGEIETVEDGGKKTPFNFLLPLLVTVVVTFLLELDILTGAFFGALSAFVLYLVERKLTFYELCDAVFEGITSMKYVFVLFVLAFTVNAVNEYTGMPGFVLDAVTPVLSGALLPCVVFIVCAVYGFFTGACWDLAMIIMPIVAPLAVAAGVDPIIAGAAVFSGALFGNVFCPYSDGVILASTVCQVRPIDTMFAIAPYMIISGVIAAVMYLVTGIIIAV
jgi:Na+/H+ antiporter NhaC